MIVKCPILSGKNNSSEVLEQAAQSYCGFLTAGRVQDQIGWGSGQPGLVCGIPGRGGKGVETRGSLWSLFTQAIL